MARSCPEVSKESAVELRLPPGQKKQVAGKACREVNDLAKSGNEVAEKIMTDAKLHLANFIAGIYNLTDPGYCNPGRFCSD